MAQSRQTALSGLAAEFAVAGVETPVMDARVLICAAAKLDHAALLRDPEWPISDSEANLILDFAARRLAGEPVARIVGYREFWSLRFKISPDVLDPRPDSEALVEAALDQLAGRRNAPLRMLDLGTGSGALLAAVLSEWPKSAGFGLDISAQACEMAQKNLETLGFGARSHIICGDWTGALELTKEGQFDLVVSNPPYIESATIPTLAREVHAHDPMAALDGGPDGLACYRQIIVILPQLLAPDGVAVLELGQGQTAAVAALAARAGLQTVNIQQDLTGIERALVLRHKHDAQRVSG